MSNRSLSDLSAELSRFAEERDWDQFHTPKNLAMALIVEAAELVEHFQWATPEESSNLPADKLEKVREELGDLLIYTVRLSDQLGVDLLSAAFEKHKLNETKYPADRVRGSAAKYTEYKDD